MGRFAGQTLIMELRGHPCGMDLPGASSPQKSRARRAAELPQRFWPILRPSPSGLDVLPDGVHLGRGLGNPPFHQVTDGDDAQQPATIDDREVANPPVRHLVHG
jgi:hypothetical protein